MGLVWAIAQAGVAARLDEEVMDMLRRMLMST